MLTDTGREKVLRVLTGQDAIENYDMLLFSNNVTVVQGTVLGDLTEVAVAGYARQPLTAFAAPTGPVAGVWSSVAANVTFLNTSLGNVSVFGWAYVGATTGVLYGGGNFGAALNLPALGSLTFSPGWADSTL